MFPPGGASPPPRLPCFSSSGAGPMDPRDRGIPLHPPLAGGGIWRLFAINQAVASSHVPLARHWANRTHIRCQSPRLKSSSRQGALVRPSHDTASTKPQIPATPQLQDWPGKSGDNAAHMVLASNLRSAFMEI